MSQIKILPSSVINKIAAGEVIDRPASVVKELIENAIDAGASKIDTFLEEGGRKLIRIVDDGSGMDIEDLALAFQSHATSKLKKADDLFVISTLGFRGEALSSIGAVSHASIISKVKGSLIGGEIRVSGGILGKPLERGAPEGTQIEVRDLFFNTPVRRKFLKTVPTEMAYISEVLTRFSLCYPDIFFTLTHNGRAVFNLPPVKNTVERIATFFGKEMEKHIIPVFLRDEKFVLSGYIMPPFFDKSNARMQFIFLNGRYIKDGTIFRAIHEAYRGKLMYRRYPVVFLFLQMEPSEVDVNVHPTKTEVRFRNSQLIYNSVLSALKEGLNKSPVKPINIASPAPYVPEPGRKLKTPENEKGELFKKSLWEQFPFEKTIEKKSVTDQGIRTDKKRGSEEKAVAAAGISKNNMTYFQIHNAFIIEETDDGLNIIDQHALHEIILYHEIKQNMLASRPLSQKLLIPELVELNPRDFFTIMSLKESLALLGVEIEEFGQRTIVVRSFPQLLNQVDIREFIEHLILTMSDEDRPDDRNKVLNNIINTMACKGAVKSGQKLDPQEIKEILEKKKNINEYTDNCPHGRPTTLYFSIDDLQKQFKRK